MNVARISTRQASSQALIQSNASEPDDSKTGQTQGERDLAAQEGMWLWAKVAAIFAGAMAMLTFIGLFLIWRTLEHTKRAANYAGDMAVEAKDATRAATAAAKAAADQAAIARDAMQNDLRAWVGISCTIDNLTPNDGEPCIGLDVVLRNYGRSPAPAAEVSLITFTQTSLASDGRIKRRAFTYQPFEPVMPGETSKEGFALSFDKEQFAEIAASLRRKVRKLSSAFA